MSETNVREGDIFRWHWVGDAGGFMPSHCCSHIARFNGKVLRDTYWYGVSGGKVFKLGDIGNRITVEFIANEDQLERVSQYSQPEKYYESEQIVNLNHPNSTAGNLYIRKGASRSMAVMRSSVEAMLDTQDRELQNVKNNIERLKDQYIELDSKPIDEISLLSLPDGN